jgi:hypothetical protein
MTKFTRFISLAAIAVLALPASAVAAQRGPVPPPPPPPPPTAPVQPIEYAVKFVCGTSTAPASTFPLVVAGNYATAINIHNPGPSFEFTHKISLARLYTGGPMTPFQPFIVLRYDETVDFDCRWIRSRLLAAFIPVGPFFTGYFVIQGARQLDVVAVYTAAPTTNNQVATMHTERVAMRRVIP